MVYPIHVMALGRTIAEKSLSNRFLMTDVSFQDPGANPVIAHVLTELVGDAVGLRDATGDSVGAGVTATESEIVGDVVTTAAGGTGAGGAGGAGGIAGGAA
jgi:hypothetical protein